MAGGADTATCNGTSAPIGLQCVGASCGDGYRNQAAGEACDVVGGGDSSGCNGTAAGTALQCKKPSACSDGYLNTAFKAGEQCDDKNTTSGDGCSFNTCQLETGFTCPTPGQPCRSNCGDGQILGSEACDDFNVNACGTCNATCSGIQTATPAIGSITAVSSSNLNNGETLTISDGVHTPVVFEFNSGAPTDTTHVQISPGNNTSSNMATKITNAINAIGAGLAISAVVNSAKPSQVLLTNGSSGSAGNVKLKATVTNTSFVVVGMSGGAGFDCPATTGCGGNDDCQSGVCCLGAPGTAACPCPTSGGSCTSFARNSCLAPSCNDNAVNGTETDLNCGGSSCPKCTTGQICVAASDCTSGVCTQSVCAAPSCGDHVRNGAETDADCGGGSCPACADGASCSVTGDCGAASACRSGKCASTCGDGLPDGNETATDCGGGICSPCADGIACLLNRDCGASSTCTGLVCTPACADGTKDGQETDTDCGGGACATCADGLACKVNGDCGTSSVCRLSTMKCTPECADGSKDGQETDSDCGGPTCAGCTSGNNCKVTGDCAAGLTCGGAKTCQ